MKFIGEMWWIWMVLTIFFGGVTLNRRDAQRDEQIYNISDLQSSMFANSFFIIVLTITTIVFAIMLTLSISVNLVSFGWLKYPATKQLIFISCSFLILKIFSIYYSYTQVTEVFCSQHHLQNHCFAQRIIISRLSRNEV